MVGTDEATLREIVASYQDSIPRHLSGLEQALDAADRAEVERSAHRITGGAANLGAERVHAVAQQIEDAAREGALETCRAKVPALRSEIAALLEALAADPWRL